MTESLIVAILAFGGTILGSIIGILTANKLVNHRIEQIEKAIDKLAPAATDVAGRIAIIERDLKTVFTRIDEERAHASNMDTMMTQISKDVLILKTRSEQKGGNPG